MTFEDLPDDVVHRMKRSLLDSLGCAILGSRLEASRVLAAYLKRIGGTGEATVIPDGYRTSTFNAVLANGTHVGATELAESFTRAVMHCGNAIPPAALAEAERQATTGRELLTAMAVGYEVAIRTGLATRIEAGSATFAAKDETRPGGPLGPNYISHPVSTFGLYGTAAAVTRILRLSREQTAQAMTLATSLTPAIGRGSGFWEGATAKDMYQGMSNAMGTMAAELAAGGMTGGTDVVAHLTSLVPDVETSVLDLNLGREWLLQSGGLHFKMHMLSGMTQPAADAALDALSKRAVQPEDVERIDVRVPDRGVRQSDEQDPATLVACTISIPYVVSAVVVHREDLESDPHFTELFTDEKYRNGRRQELARKVFVHGDEKFTRGFERQWPMTLASHVDIQLKSGDVVAGDAEIWSVTSQLSDDAVMDKFRDLAGRVLPREKVERAIDVVFAMDGPTTIDQLIHAVCL
jgi:2-methylcitrate dehydratase PrpD